jgi:glycosyltransferase involved in cell wall biosynthesis/SAM-dependent methyltransferase
MRLFCLIGFESLAWSLRRLYCPVDKKAVVLEVGSGGNPYFRANVLLDAYEHTRERHWQPLVADRPMVLGFGENLPFRDKVFDFVIASHVLEHSADPARFLSELQRVAKAGYIESPDAFMERVNPYLDHRLEITVRNGRLVIRKKASWQVDPGLVELYEHRAKAIITRDTIPKRPFAFHVRYYWRDQIDYVIENPDVDAGWDAPPGYPCDGQSLSLRGRGRGAFAKILRTLVSQRGRNRRLDLVRLLRCPACRSEELAWNGSFIKCSGCSSQSQIFNGIADMRHNGDRSRRASSDEERPDRDPAVGSLPQAGPTAHPEGESDGELLLSICIPSYNRPEGLERLLSSIDCDFRPIEVVISEDCAPRREEVRRVVERLRQRSAYKVIYRENLSNLGYDGNIRRLIEIASGTFVLFMGDDDWFKPGALDEYLAFLRCNRAVGYVLRSYFGMHPDGTSEPFRYLPGPKRFAPGVGTCAWMCKRSVSICGVTFKRESALKYASQQFDGTLLYQVYLVLEICLREESIYSDLPVAIGAQTYREDKPQFGASQSEKGRFKPGKVTFENSINFTRGFFEISQAFDRKHKAAVTQLIRKDLSKYSYPFLSIQRKRGVVNFLRYSYRLGKETGLNETWHYYAYTCALVVLGERMCDRLILLVKRRLGYTPNI